MQDIHLIKKKIKSLFNDKEFSFEYSKLLKVNKVFDNNEKISKEYYLIPSNDYLLFASISSKTKEIIYVDIVSFKDIQGIEDIHALYHTLTIQFHNGDNHVYRIKEKDKLINNQKENIGYLDTIINKKQKRNMKHSIQKQRANKNKKRTMLYVGTFIPCVVISLFLVPVNYLLTALVTVFIVHAFLFVLVETFVSRSKNKAFYNEIQDIVKNLNDTKDIQKSISAMQQIKNKPTSTTAKNDYYSLFASMYIHQKDKNRAIKYIEKMLPIDKSSDEKINELYIAINKIK